MLAQLGFRKGVVITPSDTVNLDGSTAVPAAKPRNCNAIHVGGAGIVAVVFIDDTVANFTCVAGQLLLVQAIRVNATNTTGTLLVALYQ